MGMDAAAEVGESAGRCTASAAFAAAADGVGGEAAVAVVQAASLAVQEAMAAGKGANACVDTAGWANQFGADCPAMSEHCRDGAFLPGHEWSGGELFASPELNCCACGKPDDVPTPAPTPWTCARNPTCPLHSHNFPRHSRGCQLTKLASMYDFNGNPPITFPGVGLYTMMKIDKEEDNCCYKLEIQVFMCHVLRNGVPVSAVHVFAQSV